MKQSFFFYDLETSGLSAREDRIMQFAGQRTNLNLEPVGEPVNVLVRMNEDTLPGPRAIMVTGITPQATVADGMSEAEFCQMAMNEIFTPGTIALGYNTVRFDDEFMRHTLWRNFYDAYEWEWRDGRGRWDLLDVVRMVRALRPEGIEWPFTDEGKPTNRLELITKMNGISHEHAHDALADVVASIDVARLLRERQPQMFEYLFGMREKKMVQKLVNLESKQAFVYSSGRYGAAHNFTTVAFPLTTGRNGNLLVFDLRYNLDELLEKKRDVLDEATEDGSDVSFFPVVKEFCFNKCPAVAPLGVLEKVDRWAKIDLTPEKVQENLHSLLSHPEFAEQQRLKLEGRADFPPAVEPEAALYDGFLNENDRIKCDAVHAATENQLADFHPEFTDERLPELLLHYKARNFARVLSEDEMEEWEKYRAARLGRQVAGFGRELKKCAEEFAGDAEKEFLLEELTLWAQSVLPMD